VTGLPIWDAADPTTRCCCLIGSSTFVGTLGGTDTLVDRLRTWSTAMHWGTGGSGPILVTDGNVITFTSGGASWGTVANGGTGDAGPSGGVRSGSGATRIATVTKAMPNGFRIRIVDGTSAAQFAYSIDGAAYVNTTGITYTADGTIKTTADVATPVVSSLAIRCANAAGTAAQVYLLEVEPIETGVPLYISAGRSGATAVLEMNRSSHTYLDAWLTLHTEIDLVVVCFTNDSRSDLWVSSSAFRAAYDALLTRCDAIGADLLPLIWMGRGTAPYATFPLANQDAIRTEVHDFADDNGLPCIDLRDDYPEGIDAFNAGLVADELGSNVHPTTAGQDYVAGKIWRQIARLGSEAWVRV
jgi:hypothetical protein